ncbi:hypothetical protein D9757_007385 [Collybiopsis confluens]|uniref:Uncharacterized protein n=1 Tax=Collybiopsis confluens TaxID=2823264 RepID=A0A8H5HIF3_9AGAR|nr:hypothetical protein D9757_007385 [Collybiopsis confluens]
MRTLNFKPTTRALTRFRSTRAPPSDENLDLKLSEPPDALPAPSVSFLSFPTPPIAPHTPIPKSTIPEVVGILAGPEAGGTPPFAAVYPVSGHRRPPSARLGRYTDQDLLQPMKTAPVFPSPPQDLWTRAFALAAKDVKNIPSKLLVFFIERATASYRPWAPSIASGQAASSVPVLHHPVRLTLSHYTTFVHGLLLRRHYSLALTWVRKLVYPFPSAFAPRSVTVHPNVNSVLLSRTTKHPQDAVHLSLDGRALSASLVALARLGRVHEAIKVLEGYAAPTMIARNSSHARHVRMNAIQMNDFLLVLLRWPTRRHALPVPSVQFPLRPLKVPKTRSTTGLTSGNSTDRGSVEPTLEFAISTRPTRSARPDLLLRLLPALHPRYGVVWDARTVCLMLQAVRMSSKMDGISAAGLRKVLKDMFDNGSHRLVDAFSAHERPKTESKQWWLVERIMEVLWSPADFQASASASKRFPNRTKANHRSHQKPPNVPSFQAIEYSPFTPWPWPSLNYYIGRPTASTLDTSESSNNHSGGSSPSLEVENTGGTAASSHNAMGEAITHPFILAREIFLRLVWAHAEFLNERGENDGPTNSTTYIDLYAIAPPALLPPHSLARLIDPDGDGLGHLGGLPSWFGALEGALKNKFGFGVGGGGILGTPGTNPASSPTFGGQAGKYDGVVFTRADVVDEMFGYPKNSAIPLPKLTPTAFHHYILLLGLSAPEPREFVHSGWRQWNLFEGYPPHGTAAASNQIDRHSPAQLLIPGSPEIPLALAYMRALRLVPTPDTICAAVVFWREAVGGETLFELGLRDIREYRNQGRGESGTEVGDAYADEYELWKGRTEDGNAESEGGRLERAVENDDRRRRGRPGIVQGKISEYAKFCRWIRDWVDEINSDPRRLNEISMPHPFHIHRWTGIIRKMREGQGYGEGEAEEEEEEKGSFKRRPL